jgi:hypothetical protein
MYRRLFLACAGAFCALASAPSFADLYKCVSASGTTSFSDKPCAKDGAKEVDIKDNPAYSSIIARDKDQALGHACSELQDRERHCGLFINQSVEQHFRDGCFAPLRRFELDRDVKSTKDGSGQPIDWDHDYRYHEKTTAELSCGVLVSDMWKFVKDNFSKTLTQKEIHAIDFETQANSTSELSSEQPSNSRRSKRANGK